MMYVLEVSRTDLFLFSVIVTNVNRVKKYSWSENCIKEALES